MAPYFRGACQALNGVFPSKIQPDSFTGLFCRFLGLTGWTLGSRGRYNPLYTNGFGFRPCLRGNEMGQIVDSDGFISNRLTSARSQLNAGARLRLYKSALTPTPAKVLADFTAIEADFDTYVIKTLDPNFAAGVQIQSGQYRSLSAVQTYGSPTTTGNTLYGWFIDDNAGALICALEFATPIVYSVGAPQLQIQIGYEVWAKSLL